MNNFLAFTFPEVDNRAIFIILSSRGKT